MITRRHIKINGIIKSIIFTFIFCLSYQGIRAQDSLKTWVLDSIQVPSAKKWAVEAKAGVNFPFKKLGDANLDIGYGFEGTVAYEVIPTLSTYLGWGFAKFTSGQTYLSSKLNFEESGFTFGMQHINKISDLELCYMIKLGFIYNKIVTVNTEGIIINDTRSGIGWQAGIGLALPLGTNLRLIPELRYRALSRNITIEGITNEAELHYLSFCIGVSLLF